MWLFNSELLEESIEILFDMKGSGEMKTIQDIEYAWIGELILPISHRIPSVYTYMYSCDLK